MAPKDKVSKAKEKKARRRQESEAAQSRVEAVKAAYAVDPVAEMAMFDGRFDKDGLKAKLRWASAETLSEELKETLKKMLETNMAEVYAEDWVKAKTVKEKEMVEDDARYLFVYDVSSSDKEALAGFIQYRFVIEEEVEVLYIYELQILKDFQRKGLGKFIVMIIEGLARKAGVKGVMLTCQKRNKAAYVFYKSIKYNEDAISPCNVDPYAGEEDYPYEILSKIFDPEAQRLLAERAEVAKAQYAAEY
uniref:N-alpha-acetyltransferase 40 n=1 Tax=Tetraselmis chuii TaxID=63592 RepID=A0A7S1SLR7_9CHLO|mmetsp:Transcript_14806/g.26198  ORF Transcript_14806/g.26198 Transcript_14806/m.26198 type:complete len:248 (+) Transcript_14806:148-891(+)